MSNRKHLSSAIRCALFAGAASLLATPAFAQAQQTGDEKETVLDRVEVTGSRLKRADIEGALPVTVIDRRDIEASGKTTVADVLQDATFNSFGSTRPSSGSSAQSFSELSLRGLGGGRTLILIDGRRAPSTPQFLEGGQDLNSVPLAAVERIEILTDGASAIYGADAMAGVVNIITRKDYVGAEITVGAGQGEFGGDTEEASFIIGTSNDTTRLLAGASYNKRDITFWNDLPWLAGQRGVSSFSNLYFGVITNPATGARLRGNFIANVPGGCTNQLFYINPSNGRCSYDFLRIGAASASLDTSGLFLRGDHQINENWKLFGSATITRVESFGRFAPTPENIFLTAASPNNTTGGDVIVGHRFAAAGPRDNYDDNQVYDVTLGVEGSLSDRIGLNAGIRRNEARTSSFGYNYINIPVARQLMQSGAYNIFNPNANPESVLNQIRTTTSRNGFLKQNEIFALLDAELMPLGGGTAMMAFGIENRQDDYQDIYDQQSAAGNVGGSSGNSSFGNRDLFSVFTEINLPIFDGFETNIAARYDDYSDFGSSLTPKLSLRYQPMESLSFRASIGEGFRAPPLSILNQLDSFSADSVVDPLNNAALGLRPGASVQINGVRVATPTLQAEESTQFGGGVVWDATDWLNVSLDYFNIELDNQVRFYGAQTVINRLRDGIFLPSNLGLLRDPSGLLLEVRSGYGNEGGIKTDGLDLNLRTNFDFGGWGELDSNLQMAYTNKYEISSPITGDSSDIANTAETPEWRATLSNRWAFGDFTFQWNVNAIDSTPTGDFEFFETYGYDCAAVQSYGYACRTGTYVSHDVQATWATPWDGRLSLGATNVFSKAPPVDTSNGGGYASNVNQDLYSISGRTVYVRYTQSF